MIEHDLQAALKALDSKAALYGRLWQYYDGVQPLVYSTERLRELFRDLNARFSLNWCEVVVGSVLERLEIEQLVAPGTVESEALTRLWEASGLALDADDVHLCLLVTGEAFVLAWPDADNPFLLQPYYNDSRHVHVVYHEDRPRDMRFAAKRWQSPEGARLTLYYPDALFYFGATRDSDVATANDYVPLSALYPDDPDVLDSADNPLGRIPVWHFRRERRAIRSELSASVLDVQDAINKLFADMMVAGEFGAYKQRYIISQADVGNLRNAPNEIWDLPAGDGIGQPTTVGEFAETSLENYMRPMQELAVAISKMTRTPQSYFFLGARSDPSGEALYAMETALVQKVRRYIKRLEPVWRDLIATVFDVGADVVYAEPRTQQPLTMAQTRQQNVGAGVPLVTVLRREGWTETELAQMAADRAQEAGDRANSLALAMMEQQRQFNEGEAA